MRKYGISYLKIKVPLSRLKAFFDDSVDFGNLISDSSAFSKTMNIWKFTVHVLLKLGLENFEHYLTRM